MPSAKRKKKEEDEEAQTPLSEANEKTDGRFVADYLQTETSGWITSWTHPHEQRQYGIRLARSARVDEASLQACFRLVEHTSRDDYERSRGRWKPAVKLAEMRLPDLRYLLVTDAAGAVRGFTSLMPTYEAGRPVVYCYEIHLADELQGTGLGRLLMSFLDTVAAALPPVEKVMLTCFLSNERALRFYTQCGFAVDDISPRARRLRGAKVFTPDYCIMSKPVAGLSRSTAPPT